MQTLEDRVYQYRQYGLTAVELGARVTVNGDSAPHISARDNRFLVHNYFPPPAEPFVLNLASPKENIRQRSMKLILEALALSARLGAPFYSVHAGFITDPIGTGETSFIFPMPASPAEVRLAMERFVAGLACALERAQALGLHVLVENNVCSPELHGKLLLQTAEEFGALLQTLPSSNLGILLDTGHLNVTAHTLGFNPLDFVERIAPYVRGLHVHDNDGSADTHRPAEAGGWVLEVLRRPQFAGLPIVVEARFDSLADLRSHVDWLRGELSHD